MVTCANQTRYGNSRLVWYPHCVIKFVNLERLIVWRLKLFDTRIPRLAIDTSSLEDISLYRAIESGKKLLHIYISSLVIHKYYRKDLRLEKTPFLYHPTARI